MLYLGSRRKRSKKDFITVYCTAVREKNIYTQRILLKYLWLPRLHSFTPTYCILRTVSYVLYVTLGHASAHAPAWRAGTEHTHTNTDTTELHDTQTALSASRATEHYGQATVSTLSSLTPPRGRSTRPTCRCRSPQTLRLGVTCPRRPAPRQCCTSPLRAGRGLRSACGGW